MNSLKTILRMITPSSERFYNDYIQFQLKSPFSSLILHLNSVSLFFYNYKISFLWDVREINIPLRTVFPPSAQGQ